MNRHRVLVSLSDLPSSGRFNECVLHFATEIDWYDEKKLIIRLKESNWGSKTVHNNEN